MVPVLASSRRGGTAGLAAPGYQSLSASGVTINNNQASTQNITWTCFGN